MNTQFNMTILNDQETGATSALLQVDVDKCH